jgi:hypothetical protein
VTAALFEVGPADVADTTDDWYTPTWLFRAAGIMFDLDVAAPVDPARRTCPARSYLTAVEDGLTHPWHGVVWMNPPYSKAAPWVDRWAAHPAGMALLPAMCEVKWLGVLMGSADGTALLSVDFGRPSGGTARLRWPLVLAARGKVGTSALARVAAADKYAAGAYHVRPGGLT